MRRHLVLLAGGVALGVGSLVVARSDAEGAISGASAAANVALLGAGWALFACGLLAWVRRPASRFGAVLASAGVAWFLIQFNNPGAGSPALFTIGLVTYAACPAVVAHAALAYPSGDLPGRLARTGIALAYGGAILVLGLAPALVADPAREGCSQCPRNLFAVTSMPGLAQSIDRLGLGFGIVWALGLAALALLRLARSSPPARLAVAPVLLSATVYLSLVATDYAHGLGRGFVSNDDVDSALWFGQATALFALVVGVVLTWVRGWRARTTVTRFVVAMGASPDPGGLRDVLARALGDPALELAYTRSHDRYVDADGRPIDVHPGAGRAATPLLRGGRPVALLVHRAELLDDGGLIEAVGAAARLALDHERLQAEVRAQLEDLRTSRARSVEAGDAERRRLERNLHDGAQQRLVVLSLALRMLRAEVDGAAASRVDAADSELRRALAELRDLARGIYPAVLTDEGLGPAIEALAEGSLVPIEIESLPRERLEPAVEAAAYFLVAEVVKRSITSAVTVRAGRSNGHMSVEIHSSESLSDDLVDLEDRIGALDGELAVERATTGQTTIYARIPCGS